MAKSSNKAALEARRTALLYGWLWKGFGFFWGTIVLGLVKSIVFGIISSFVPKDWATFLQKPIEWAFQNLLIVALVLAILALLTYIVYLKNRQLNDVTVSSAAVDLSPLPSSQPYQPKSQKDLEQRYLQRMIRENRS